jgi:tetratricopeptide (TPR) repeat protein
MGPLYRVPAVPRPRTTLLGSALGLALVAGCAGARQRPDEKPQPELLVEVLPRGARVALDGRPLPAANRPVPAPPRGLHRLTAEADGYEPAERDLPEGDLAGVRVALALRPAGLAFARALDYDDAEGLAAAAAFLARSGADRDAADYADRAAALDPRLPLARRVLGDALFRLGDRSRAVDAWTEYLKLWPDAPDAAAVSDRIDEARADVRVR